MKIFYLSLEEHERNIIDFGKKEVLLLTKEELKLYQNAKVCYISGKRILKNTKDKNYQKVRDHCHYTGKYRGTAHSICNLKFKVLNEIPVVFLNGSNYDHDFIIKELAYTFEGQLECLGENKEKQKTFSIPIKKEITKINKDGNESIETLSYRIKFINRMRFMGTSLSHLVDKLLKRVHEIECKDCGCFLEYEIVMDELIKYVYLAIKIIQTSLMKN